MFRISDFVLRDWFEFMSHGMEEHLEHAEHAQHAEHIHDPFFRRVAMTMAIVAAVLACVTMLSHRAHTETLRLQNEATIHHTQASNQWAYFQAKKNREYFYDVSGVILEPIASKAENSKALLAKAEEWKSKVQRYEKEAAEIQSQADALTKRGDEFREESQHAHHRADRFDLGDVLTKRAEFWYAGIASGIVGAAIAASGFLLH